MPIARKKKREPQYEDWTPSGDEFLQYSELRDTLASVLDRIDREGQRVVVTRNNKPEAVLVSMDEWRALLATVAVLSDETMMEAIRAYEKAPQKTRPARKVFAEVLEGLR